MSKKHKGIRGLIDSLSNRNNSNEIQDADEKSTPKEEQPAQKYQDKQAKGINLGKKDIRSFEEIERQIQQSHGVIDGYLRDLEVSRDAIGAVATDFLILKQIRERDRYGFSEKKVEQLMDDFTSRTGIYGNEDAVKFEEYCIELEANLHNTQDKLHEEGRKLTELDRLRDTYLSKNYEELVYIQNKEEAKEYDR